MIQQHNGYGISIGRGYEPDTDDEEVISEYREAPDRPVFAPTAISESYLGIGDEYHIEITLPPAGSFAAGDKPKGLDDTSHMSEMNREELDAKLSAVEARMDKRISDFGADMRQVVSDFRVEMAPMKNLKTSIWSAAGFIVASMIAVIGLTVTGFYTGRDTSNLINEARVQSQETRKLLEQIQLQQRTPPPTTNSPQK